MLISLGGRSAGACLLLTSLVTVALRTVVSAQDPEWRTLDLVAVAIIDEGRAVLLATPGLPHNGNRWRFRSLDTSGLPQPIQYVQLASTGTKLFLQPADGAGVVLDLTRQHHHNTPMQYVDPREVASDGDARGQSHSLPRERFISVRNGVTSVVGDTGALRPEPASQTLAADSDDRPALLDGQHGNVPSDLWRHALAALQAGLPVTEVSTQDAQVSLLVEALVLESAGTWGSGGRQVTAWRFFKVGADAELYAPVLQFARIETVFPAAFDTLEDLARVTPVGTRQPTVELLYQRYLRLDLNARRQLCTFYYRTHSAPGSWIIEYWFYYPFDAGGLGSHPHDPEHMFVEVDKLGGAPRRVIGAGHGYMAGNNSYRADRRGAHALTLPLFAIVELGKHAMAPDVDRDGVFTPGIDENEYRERAKIWGVRDVIGRINNQLLAFDITMSVHRRAEDALALGSMRERFPDQPDLAALPACRLEPIPEPQQPSGLRRVLFRLSDWVIVPPCHDSTGNCARLHVTAHPDFLDVRTILKEWSFPDSFLRAGYGVGPRRGLHTVGLGYAMDLDRVPIVGRVLPLPGRLGAEVFRWRQSVDDADRDSCLAGCGRREGIGAGLRYEQFLSNLFGFFSAARVYSPPARDAWITFGPFVELPLGRRSNMNVQGGLSFSAVCVATLRVQGQRRAVETQDQSRRHACREGSPQQLSQLGKQRSSLRNCQQQAL